MESAVWSPKSIDKFDTRRRKSTVSTVAFTSECSSPQPVMDKLAEWESYRKVRLNQKRRMSLQSIERTLKEVPSINDRSRKLAHAQFTGPVQPMTYINPPEEPEIFKRDYLLIKNSLKNMNSELPLKLNLKLDKYGMSVFVAPQEPPTLKKLRSQSKLIRKHSRKSQ